MLRVGYETADFLISADVSVFFIVSQIDIAVKERTYLKKISYFYVQF